MQLKEHTNASVYFELLAHLDDAAKKALIAHLSAASTTAKKRKPKSFKQLFGAWKGRETAEEIIVAIRKSRTSKRKIEAL